VSGLVYIYTFVELGREFQIVGVVMLKLWVPNADKWKEHLATKKLVSVRIRWGQLANRPRFMSK